MSIPKEVAATMLKALELYRGDDLHRAERAFKGMTKEQMAEQYGESGETRQQILDRYRAFEERVWNAVRWVKANRSHT